MKHTRILIVFAAITFSCILKAHGQNIDSARRSRMNYFRSLLQTDSVTAKRVMEIQNHYKQEVKLLLTDVNQNEGRKRRVLDSLMSEKNRQLEELLPEEQRNKLIPTTERRRTWKRDTTAKNNR